MPVTITRTARIDDDGTGTTGTVINNAEKTSLYNEIDTALAKVAQLAGGNAFTGNQSVAGVLSVTGFGTHGFVGTGAGLNILAARNTAAGTGNGAQIMIGNDADPALTLLRSSASNWTADSYPANGTILYGAGVGGLGLAAASLSGSVRVYAGGSSERLRILPTGEVCINTTASQTGQLTIVTDQVHTGFIIQNSSPANGLSMVFFLNSAAGACGSITQTGATSVAYNTTSDGRLKDDAGRATDLSSLRAVTVHDFTWKADGVRARGVFAQEAHDVFPHAITRGTDETTDGGSLARPWMTDYSKFVPDLIVGWQQHDAEIAELRAMFATVKG